MPSNAAYSPLLKPTKRLTFWICLCLLIAGWAVAIVFMIMWERCHEYVSLPPAFISESWMGRFKHAAIATDDSTCSEIGNNILQRGGNAMDAAIAVLFCDGIQNPQSMGIGGGFFMVVFNATTKTCTSIDAREMAPKTLPNLTASGDILEQFGWKSIAVPGEIKGYWEAYKLFGNLPWADLVQPTYELATKGAYVHSALAWRLDQANKWGAMNDSTMNIFLDKKTGSVYKEGDILKYPLLAKTLSTLMKSRNPAQEFYEGTIAKQIVQEFKEKKSTISLDDLKAYNVKISPAWNVTLKDGSVVCVPHLPSSGPALTFFLQLVEALQVGKKYSFKKEVDDAVHAYHYLIEASKFSFAEWAQLADPAFHPNVEQTLRNLTDPDYLQSTVEKITNRAAKSERYYLKQSYEPEKQGTAHFSIVDAQGNAVSVTSSINYLFGAHVRSPTTGILWNNHLADFSNRTQSQNPFNYMEPGKRPRSAMTPVIVVGPKANKPRLVVGASGGQQILSAVSLVTSRVLFFNETVKEAMDAPRVHNALFPYVTQYEQHMPEVVVKRLKDHKHVMKTMQQHSQVEAVEMRDDVLYANTDYRKPSNPAGY